MDSARQEREVARIDADLEAIVILTRQAALHLTPSPRGLCGGTGTQDSRPPLDVRALDDEMAADVLPMLESWEVSWRRHAGLSPYGPVSIHRVRHAQEPVTATLKGVTRFLRANLSLMVQDETWPWALMGRTIHSARTALAWHDETDPAPQIRHVPCPGAGPEADGRYCGWDLELEPGERFIHCPSCLTTWTIAELALASLVALSPDAAPVWATPAELQSIGIDPATLRKWYQRGLITRHGSFYDAKVALERIIQHDLGVL